LPASSAPPVLPTITKLQLLPFIDLAWENFERLSLRLIELDSEVEYCQLYGVPGQNQEGIDIYARSNQDGKYRVLQCKRLKLLAPSDIRDAVTRFLDGKWADKATWFVFCTSHQANETQIADEIETQAKKLRAAGVEFEVWHRDSLSARLKSLPGLVDDFFGRHFVTAFCGAEIAESLSNRLDAHELIEYRDRLGRFYRHVFTSHDPGLPLPGEFGLGRVDLLDRYVIPDLNVRVVPTSSPSEERGPEFSEAETARRLSEDSQPIRQPSSHHRGFPQVMGRMSLDAWLSQADRSVILGGPGSGKSALLRFLILDLLSKEPVLERTISRWGNSIPIWISFPFWTRLIATGPGADTSLVDCLKSWFAQWDEIQLWPLVERAIRDQRLLIVVDGLDEWTSEETGRIAVQKLQWFVESRNLPAIVVSRPYGYERIGLNGASWQVSELAPLSQEQKRELCLKWLSIWHARRSNPRTMSSDAARENKGVERESSEFLTELNGSENLSDLSSVPLLLLLLLGLHIQGKVLPRSRFEAYEYMVNHLIRDHPMAKRVAAMTAELPEVLSETELHHLLAYVSFVAQQRFPAGIIPEAEIRATIQAFLGDEESFSLGLTETEVGQHLKRFFRLEEGNVGLLISPITGQFSFLHRSFQEFLAGTHVARLSLAQQKDLVRLRAADPRWKDVILVLLWRTRRPQEVDELVAAIKLEGGIELDDFARRELLAEVSFGEFNTTAAQGREIANSICDEIEENAWTPHRTRLVSYAINGLSSSRTRQLVSKRLKSWVFGRGDRSWGIRGMKNWPPNDHTWYVLSSALRDEELYVKRAAADSMASSLATRFDVGDSVASAAASALDPEYRAALLEGLIRGWPAHPKLPDAIELARNSEDPTLRAVALYGRVCVGKQNDDDLTELLNFMVAGRNSLSLWWRDLVPDTLVLGWKNNERLKAELLGDRPLVRGYSTRWDRDMAAVVLASGFPNDPDVANAIAELVGQQFGFSMASDIWSNVARNFKNNPTIVAAVDDLAKQLEHGHEREFSLIAAVGGTSTIKKKLVDLLDHWVPFWAAGTLLREWGMADPEVAAALSSMASQPRSSEIAQYIPQIIADPTLARQKLLELVRNPESRRLDFIIRGFSELTERGNEREIVEECLEAIGDGTKVSFADMSRSALIQGFSSDSRVREFAISSLDGREAPLGAIAEAYAYDEEIRTKVAEQVIPLPTVLRYQIVDNLIRNHETSLVVEILGRWDEESDAETKTLASIGYHDFLVKTHSDKAQAIARLQDCIPCYGLDHDARRQAAFPGLVLLDQVQILKSKGETVAYEGQRIVIPFERGTKANLVLVDFIGAHWDSIKVELGKDLSAWFTRPVDEKHFWELMSVVATQYPSLQSDLRAVISGNDPLMRTPAVLRFVARSAPKSRSLLEACLSVLKGHDTSFGWLEGVEVAASLLAGHFSGEEDVADELARILRTDMNIFVGPVMALCIGWPKSPMLTKLFEYLSASDNNHFGGLAEDYVLYTKLPEDDFCKRLDRDIAEAARNHYHPRGFVEPALARTRRDSQIADRLFKVLQVNPSTTTKASYVGLIAAAHGVSAELAEWCSSQLHIQGHAISPEIAYDVMWPGYRALALCLLDALNSVEDRRFSEEEQPH
jgi:hypothetical protein